MALTLYLPTHHVQPTKGELRPVGILADLVALAAFRAALPLHDNLAWLALDEETGEVADMSPACRRICAAHKEIFGFDPIEKRRAIMGADLGVLPELRVPAGKGEYRITMTIGLAKRVSFEEGAALSLRLDARRFNEAGKAIAFAGGDVKLSKTVQDDISAAANKYFNSEVAFLANCDSWQTIDRASRKAHSKTLEDLVSAVLRKHLRTVKALKGKADKRALASHAPSEWFCLVMQGAFINYMSFATTTKGALLQVEAAKHLGTDAHRKARAVCHVTACRQAKKLLGVKVSSWHELAMVLEERFNAGMLAYSPGYNKTLEGWSIKPEHADSFVIPGEPADLEQAMTLLGHPFFEATKGSQTIRSAAFLARDAEQAQIPGTNEWFTAQYAAMLGDQREEKIPFGDGHMLTFAVRLSGARGPELSCCITERDGEPVPQRGPHVCTEDQVVLDRRWVGLAAYKAWSEEHPDGEPYWLDDAIRLRRERLADIKARIFDTLPESIRAEIAAFAEAFEAGQPATLTLPRSLYTHGALQRLAPGVVGRLCCTQIDYQGEQVVIRVDVDG